MRYAIFTDIHANLEALEAILAKIDQLAEDDPIDQIWFLGDLVGYGPNPNECITKLRERTDVMIAGNHDWAAVGKIDLEDFSEAARISAQWTAKQLTEEHRTFLANLPERLERDDCTLVHGSPYGPLWEYLTSEVLAERSFQHFSTRFCIVGHTHVPVIFQQPDLIANSPTAPLELDPKDASEYEALQRAIEQAAAEDILVDLSTTEDAEIEDTEDILANLPITEDAEIEDIEDILANLSTTEDAQIEDAIEANVLEDSEQASDDNEEQQKQEEKQEQEETQKRSVVQYASRIAAQSDRVYTEVGSLEEVLVETADVVAEVQYQMADDIPNSEIAATPDAEETTPSNVESTEPVEQEVEPPSTETPTEQEEVHTEAITPEATIQDAEDRLNAEIEELLNLLGLSQSMINITNEMIIPQ